MEPPPLPRARRVGRRRGSESRGGRARLGPESLNPRERGHALPPPRARETASSSTTPSAAALAAARDAAFEPVGWREYFDRALDIPVGDVDVFRVYTARDEGANDAAPASSASSASSAPIDTIVLCVHGCPCTALSWAPAARALARASAPRASSPPSTSRPRRDPVRGRLRAGRRHARRGPRRRRRRAPPTIRIKKNRGRERTRTEAPERVSRGTQRGRRGGGARGVLIFRRRRRDIRGRRDGRRHRGRGSRRHPAHGGEPRRRRPPRIVRLRTRRRRVGAARGYHAKRGRRARLRPLATRATTLAASAMTTPPKVRLRPRRCSRGERPSPRRGRTGAGGSKVYRARFSPRRVRNCWCWRASIDWTTNSSSRRCPGSFRRCSSRTLARRARRRTRTRRRRRRRVRAQIRGGDTRGKRTLRVCDEVKTRGGGMREPTLQSPRCMR